jgi:23S rRNA U2552 (ribose-2'-O)-methylase RlmE/FtsJ
VRSVICRWVKNDGNRYFGEYKLVEINDEYRIWQRISTEVELATCA